MNERFIKITIEKAELIAKQGNITQALAVLNDALTLYPDNVELNFQRIAIYINSGNFDAVSDYLDSFSQNLSDHGMALFRIGRLLYSKGLYQIALEAFSKTTEVDSFNAWAYNNLSLCYINLGNLPEAYTSLIKAIELKPDCAEFHNNIANLFMMVFRLSDAVRHYQRALMLNPECVEAYANLGRAYHLCGDVRGFATVLKALERDPSSRAAVDVLLLTLHYFEQNPLKIFDEHTRWATSAYHALPEPPNFQDIDRNNIHIGFVSADFKAHPVATFFAPVLRYYDRINFEIFCYSQVSNPDTTTLKLKELGGLWKSVVGLSDHEMADLVRQDGIDILVDLSGFTEGNRLGTFALKPAPIQCTWLGYPNTTGLPQIDYRITDAISDPPGITDHLYTEKLVRLPRTFLCYSSETTSSPLHSLAGPITFCCFNHLPKLSEPLISMWAEILNVLSDAKILLKSAFFCDQEVCNMILSRFKARGVDTNKIDLRGFTATKKEHLELYNECHIALDTYPYHGTTTTCEALWMGVPVISLAGPSHVSRVGTSILTNVGVPELIAVSPDEYVKHAVKLAHDRARIDIYRNTLRMKIQSSALMDAPSFVADLETAFKEMVHRKKRSNFNVNF
jgi:predicted O-linked N-acetylglucosamine transferase (SPINDLY family)